MPEQSMDLLRLRTTPPAVPPGFLDRPRLDEAISTASGRLLTLLCAGPGHGKTLALASWIKQRTTGNVAWLTLDDADNDPQAFWSDLLTALTINGSIPQGNPLRELMPAAWFDTNATALISAGLAALLEPIVVVLDDFQAITDSRVLRSFQRLLDHQPPQLHIILSTRADPQLHLQRRRVTGDLADIRAGDLAFTEAEAGKLLAGCGIHLIGSQLGALLDRTRGWAAGLRLAVLSLDACDIDDAIGRFTGNNGLVAEYLVEEVLDRMPAADRHFLLTTSIAERVHPALANQLTQRADSHQVLERLVAQNALVVELAGESDWFRFHPMLRELLLRRLTLEQPRTADALHRQAAQWFGSRGDAVPAITHACQAQDWDLVGRLLVTCAWPLALTPSGPALAAALQPAVASALRGPTAFTLLAAAIVHYQRHDFPTMLQECDAAAMLICEVPAQDRTAVQCLIGTLRIAHSRIVNPADTEGAARRQLEVLAGPAGKASPTAEYHRVIATNNLAVGQLWAGHLDEAAANLRAARTRCQELGVGLTELSVHGHLALLDVIHGRLPAAKQRAEAALATANRRGWTAEPQALGLRAAITLVDLEQGRHPAALSMGDYEPADGDDNDIGCLLILAIAAVDSAAAPGDATLADEAVMRLESIALRAGRLPSLLAGWCTAAHAVAELAAGRWEGAIQLIRAADAGSAYPDAIGRIVMARAQLGLDQPQRAVDALHPLLSAAPRFRGPAVEARILAAVAADRMHRDTAALTFLTEAIGLAESVGLIRPFVAAGPQIPGLLERHRHVVARNLNFTARLAAVVAGKPAPKPADRPAVRFTEREMAVLVYLPTMLTAAEIATDLFVTVNTVKTHQHSIYQKLGVNSRRAAVDRARESNLLTDPAGLTWSAQRRPGQPAPLGAGTPR